MALEIEIIYPSLLIFVLCLSGYNAIEFFETFFCAQAVWLILTNPCLPKVKHQEYREHTWFRQTLQGDISHFGDLSFIERVSDGRFFD